MMKQFMDILERMRHLNRDQKNVFYAFVYENRENISILSIPEKRTLYDFTQMCVDHVEYLLARGDMDRGLPHVADQLDKLNNLLKRDFTDFINK